MKIREAKMHDKNFLKDMRVPRYSMLVFDKAYNYYKQFARWTFMKSFQEIDGVKPLRTLVILYD
jgi:hypothetical protein